VIFPVSKNESRGIEDARFVQFFDDKQDVTYYATYTAYNGIAILPQLIETKDFIKFNILTLNGESRTKQRDGAFSEENWRPLCHALTPGW
jgi:predicted GH43/DUF377 family glycosyl hydrolase